MPHFWETAFCDNQLMWGLEPSASALFAKNYFATHHHHQATTTTTTFNILIPGIGYGRNAKPFLESSDNMSVTGIEVSQTAIDLARSTTHLKLSPQQLPIHQGSVEDMPFDDEIYDGIFCFGLLYLLDPAAARNKMLQDCYNQLQPGGYMIFTVISKKAPFYAQGTKLDDEGNTYERVPGLSMFFYDDTSIERDFRPYGLVEYSEIDEQGHNGQPIPFINVICQKKQT